MKAKKLIVSFIIGVWILGVVYARIIPITWTICRYNSIGTNKIGSKMRVTAMELQFY